MEKNEKEYFGKEDIENTGYWLIRNAHDAWYANNITVARELLCQVSDVYWERYFPKHLQEEQKIREMVADLVMEFGVVDFRLLRDRGIKA